MASTNSSTQIGDNITRRWEGTKLILEIETSTELGESASGKSIIVASTHGGAPLANGLTLNLNLYRKVEGAPKKTHYNGENPQRW